MKWLEWFLFAFNAVAPILLLILFGYWLKKKRVLDESFLRQGNRFVFRYSISVLIFYNMYNVPSLGDIPLGTVLFIVVILGLLSLLGLAAGYLFTDQHDRRGVIAQTWMRSNSAIIGLPLAAAIGGSAAEAVLAPLQLPGIIMYNSMSVIFLSVFSRDSGKKIDWKHILFSIPKNPLICGIMAGVGCLVIRALEPAGTDGLPVFTLREDLPFLYSAISMVARLATPFSLITLGGQFDFKAVGGLRRELISTSLGRLMAAPALGFGIGYLVSRAGLFAWTPALVASFCALFASPVSVSSAPMAAEMHADEALAGQLVVWTSIGSVFSLFFWLVLFQAVGWL